MKKLNKNYVFDLKNIKRSVCGQCHKKSIPGQPLERCKECKKKFCPDHFWRGQYATGRTRTDEDFGVVCDECKEKFGYLDYKEEIRSRDDVKYPFYD